MLWGCCGREHRITRAHPAAAAEWPELLVQTEAPAPGIAHLFPLPMAGQVFLTGRMYLFGKDAAETVALVQPAWEKRIGERFAPVGG